MFLLSGYIDVLEVATKSTAGSSPEFSGTKPVRVAANSRVTPPGNFITGEVDEVRVWNVDLTGSEVSAAFAGTNFNTGIRFYILTFLLYLWREHITTIRAWLFLDLAHKM